MNMEVSTSGIHLASECSLRHPNHVIITAEDPDRIAANGPGIVIYEIGKALAAALGLALAANIWFRWGFLS
jgi:hypothetical protein